MNPYIIFRVKEEVEEFCRKVDNALGFPKEIALATTISNTTGNKITYATYATPIKKYNDEQYAYPVSDAIQHLIPAGKELRFDLGNWNADGII
ncbi:hypothetical protein [Adhaeribacter aquaticus]|uniref:hypothetical protein n=1 Tax=Adhaeribacter aquaticus TaxID=299567 RepID=UPI00040412B4|nr:hypothetical protein [Adhaeribacter aquaticus]